MDDDLTWDAPLVMGLVYTLIYGAMITMIVLVQIPQENAQTVNVLAGAMTIIQTTIVQYFFGATKSADVSKAKTDTALRDIATQIAPVIPAAGTKNGVEGGDRVFAADEQANRST